MQEKNRMGPSLYIHIPFCSRKCGYCDFYSVAYDETLASSYVDTLIQQMEEIEEDVSTVFIGGGTPTALSVLLLKKFLRGTRKFAGRSVEFSVEANPESLTVEKLDLFLDEGVNRLSIGVQSFSDAKLKRLGRIHNAKKAVDSVMLAKKKGFGNLNIDLIFGAPEETVGQCLEEFKRAAELPVTHISCYCLTYEKGTPLFEARKKGKVVASDEEYPARMYSSAIDFFPRHGFSHYEVSNFAKEGFACRHNLNYWENGEYFGLGASAVSYIGGVRKKNIADVKEYIGKAASGKSTSVSSERLTGERKARETAAVKIRMAEGIDFSWFKRKTGYDLLKIEDDALKKFSGAGLIKYRVSEDEKAGIFLTKKGFLFCDTVSSGLL